MKRTLTSLFLTALLSLAGTNVWALSDVDGVYQIGTAQDLTDFAALVNGGTTTAPALVTADIDMAGQGWTGMTAYAGTFDGGSFTISNLGAPFCLTTEGDCVIRNLTLAAADTLVNTGAVEGFGAFICQSNKTAAGTTTLVNCVNKTIVKSGKKWVGGFVGASSAGNKASTTTITSCQNLAAVSSESEAVAGFVGSHRLGSLVIENSTNSGKIDAGTAAAGGFIGQAQGNNSLEASISISNCQNTGVIKTTTDRAGGIVGATYGLTSATITRCWNEGAVTAVTNRAAGIIGYLPNWTDVLTVSECFNVAEINAANYAGAIVGTESKLYKASTVTNCWNSGTVSGNAFSSTNKITCSNCFDVNGSGTGITQVTAEQVANGEVAYKLNGDQSVITWYQSLGKDKYPTLDSGSRQVFAAGEKYTNFVIGTPAELSDFATAVAGGETDLYATLSADIDMEGQAWTGISGFTGTLEGADFKISNLAGPLFATTGNGVKIQNLTLEGAITASADNAAAFIAEHNGARINLLNLVNKTTVTSTANNVAAFIGKATLSSNAANSIVNCINEAAISGADNVGAIIGQQAYSSGSGTECLNIEDCGNKAAISGTSCVGGLVGVNNAMLNYTRSWNEGAITGGDATGGLLGRNLRGWQYFRFCHNSGEVKGANYVAGLFGDYNRGSLSYTTFEDSYNEGTVRGTGDNIGGLLGRAYVSTGSPFVFTHCYNKGDIYGPKAYRPRALHHWTNAKVTMTSCWNIGEVHCIDGEFTDGTGIYTMTYLSSYSRLALTNSYDLANVAMAPKYGRPAGYEDEWLTNGHFCYLLNGDSLKNIHWYQTIGEDVQPMLDATHGIVNQITAAGYATQYIADTDVEIPADVKAYAGKVNGDWLTLTEVENKIAAATPVILEGAEGYYSFVPTTGADAVAENDLIGVTKKTAADGSQYVLAKKDEVVGFYQATEGDIVAGKAYLTGIPAGVKVVTFGTATSLTPALSEEREAVIYDLSGRRVEKATKGIYIINGKKVLK